MVGTVAAYNRRDGQAFTPHDLQMLQALGDMVVMALDRAAGVLGRSQGLARLFDYLGGGDESGEFGGAANEAPGGHRGSISSNLAPRRYRYSVELSSVGVVAEYPISTDPLRMVRILLIPAPDRPTG